MRRRRGGQKESVVEGGELNLTPLLDVVFVILIMFIIIAPLLELDKVHLASAPAFKDKEIEAVKEANPVAIYVREDNTIWMNNRMVSLDQLLVQLKEARRRSPQKTAQLFHDKKGYFGTYQSVKNCVEAAGFEELDVILQPR